MDRIHVKSINTFHMTIICNNIMLKKSISMFIFNIVYLLPEDCLKNIKY